MKFPAIASFFTLALTTILSMAAEPVSTASAVSASASSVTASVVPPPNTGIMVMLFLVLILVVGATWWLKRYGPAARQAGQGNIRIVSGVHLGNRERIVVVEVADQWIVVGVSPGRITPLSTMPKQESASAPANMPAAGNFSAWLKHTIEKRNGNPDSLSK